MMRSAMKRLVVVWRATERCDAACGFCAYDVRLRRTRRDADAEEAARFGALAAEWAAARGRELMVSWLGGEPFLWQGLREVSDGLRARGVRVALTSNGRARGEPAWRAWAAATLGEVTLSLDGPPALHDRLRGRAGLGRAVLAAIEALRESMLVRV